jgi:hypothetical protein
MTVIFYTDELAIDPSGGPSNVSFRCTVFADGTFETVDRKVGRISADALRSLADAVETTDFARLRPRLEAAGGEDCWRADYVFCTRNGEEHLTCFQSMRNISTELSQAMVRVLTELGVMHPVTPEPAHTSSSATDQFHRAGPVNLLVGQRRPANTRRNE